MMFNQLDEPITLMVYTPVVHYAKTMRHNVNILSEMFNSKM